MKLRGPLALVCIAATLLLSDPVQRLVIAPLVRLFPSRRIPVLTRWQNLMADVVLGGVRRIGGAKVAPLPKIPGGPGVLVVMNHQSLLDIPLVVSVLQGTYPRIVTRARYTRWIPLISHMTRLYKYPVVDPRARGAELRGAIATVREQAATADVPIAIFPEGTRTRDGEIGPFRPRGLEAILAARPWTVWIVVGDGFWQRARFKDFLGDMKAIEGKVEVVGPFEWHDPEADPGPFIGSLRQHAVERLGVMRAELPA